MLVVTYLYYIGGLLEEMQWEGRLDDGIGVMELQGYHSRVIGD
jgi:hypothetical protein